MRFSIIIFLLNQFSSIVDAEFRKKIEIKSKLLSSTYFACSVVSSILLHFSHSTWTRSSSLPLVSSQTSLTSFPITTLPITSRMHSILSKNSCVFFAILFKAFDNKYCSNEKFGVDGGAAVTAYSEIMQNNRLKKKIISVNQYFIELRREELQLVEIDESYRRTKCCQHYNGEELHC